MHKLLELLGALEAANQRVRYLGLSLVILGPAGLWKWAELLGCLS